MAFLSKSERDFNFGTSNLTLNTKNTLTTSTAGPGSYEINQSNISNKINTTYQYRELPFNSTAKRLDYDIIVDPLRSYSPPGPGAYLSIESSNLIKPTKNSSIPGFLSKDVRFKYKINENPGPGLYEGESHKYDKFKKKRKPRLLIVKSNNEKKKENKDNESEEEIGPGEYEISPTWVKNSIDWSKMSAKQGCNFGNNDLNDINKDEEKEKYEMKIDNINEKNKNRLKSLNEMYKRLKGKKKELVFESIKESLRDVQEEKIKINPEMIKKEVENCNFGYKPKSEFQYFGSTSPRISSFNPTNTAFPGPGAYQIDSVHNNMYKHKHLKKHKTKVTHKSVPGINGLLITSSGPVCRISTFSDEMFGSSQKQTPNIRTSFGSSEIRFRYQKTSTKDLGPGSYDCIPDFVPKFNRRKIVPDNITMKSNDEIFRINQMFKTESTPPIGSYNIERVQSIEGDLNKIKKNSKIPFGAISTRFLYKNRNNNPNIGPGTYLNQENLKNQALSSKNYKNIPFNSTTTRNDVIGETHTTHDPSEIRLKSESGPGRYKIDSYYDWNKKSYNIQYV